MSRELIFYQFSRTKVERGDFSHFLSLYGPDKLPTGVRLGQLLDRLAFGIDGYDNAPREIHSIPEIRRFYASFHEAWPYWFYFGNLDTEALRMLVLCCLPSIAALKIDGRPNVAVEYDPLELIRFIGRNFGPMNIMCDRASMSERQIYDRTKAVFEYFELPFDADPPT